MSKCLRNSQLRRHTQSHYQSHIRLRAGMCAQRPTPYASRPRSIPTARVRTQTVGRGTVWFVAGNTLILTQENGQNKQ